MFLKAFDIELKRAAKRIRDVSKFGKARKKEF